mmetsp:Transcript_7473/g.17570  ORF Transcript_7473/g.17570 Transcript_7473/m.17570 type:complete len:215 (-) Transcript_7473:752-1396(-)
MAGLRHAEREVRRGQPAVQARVLLHHRRRRLHPLSQLRYRRCLQEGPVQEAALQDRHWRRVHGRPAGPQEVQALRAGAARVPDRHRPDRLRVPRLRRQEDRDVRQMLADHGAGGARAQPDPRQGLRLRAPALRLLGPSRHSLLGLRHARARNVQRCALRRRRLPRAQAQRRHRPARHRAAHAPLAAPCVRRAPRALLQGEHPGVRIGGRLRRAR